MTDDKRKKPGQDEKSPQADLLKTAFAFFSGVRDSLKEAEPVIKVLWGIEVLLFAILALMVLIGGITGDQRFYLALVTIVFIVVVFVLIALRSQAKVVSPETARPAVIASPELTAQAQRCLDLLVEIRDANVRIIDRGRRGLDPWKGILADTYNRVCRTCYERRLGTGTPDNYFDVICAEPDIDTVCKRKWDLGETLEVYRVRIGEPSSRPRDHEELELLIRRSVTQPDCSPAELDAAVSQAIEAATRVLKQT